MPITMKELSDFIRESIEKKFITDYNGSGPSPIREIVSSNKTSKDSQVAGFSLIDSDDTKIFVFVGHM